MVLDRDERRHVMEVIGSGGHVAVSVIMSTFCRNHSEAGCANLLRRALDSVMAQTFLDFELVLIDDGSTDGTQAVCEQYAAKDTRIRLVRYERKSDLPSARYNAGMRMARGDYFMFMFDDDEWKPNAVADLYGAITGRFRECGMVYGMANLVNTSSGKTFYYGYEWRMEELLRRNIVLNIAVIVKRDVVNAVGGYDESLALRRNCDWDLWLRIGGRYQVGRVDVLVGTAYSSYRDSLECRYGESVGSFGGVMNKKYGLLPLHGELVGNVVGQMPDEGPGVVAIDDPLMSMEKFRSFGKRVHLPVVSVTLETRKDMLWRTRKIVEWHRRMFGFHREVVISNIDPMIPGVTFVGCGEPPKDIDRFQSWYSDICIRWLRMLCDASHVLLWHWDGFIINADAWTDEFLKWDYIGAPIVSQRWYTTSLEMEKVLPGWKRPFANFGAMVGNGGFSLRSRRFLEASASLDKGLVSKVEDMYLCVERRRDLEKLGMKFAPLEVASRFSASWSENKDASGCFGFHDGRHFAAVKLSLEDRYLTESLDGGLTPPAPGSP